VSSPAPARLPISATASPQNIFFRVSGTNRSLNQAVLFNGQLLRLSPQPPAAAVSSAAGTVGGRMQFEDGNRWSQLSGGQVMGSVLIGGTNQVEINAESVKP
jgi:hypothetical protein